MARTGHLIAFLSIFTVLMALSHFYLFVRLNSYLQLSIHNKKILATVFGVLAFLTVICLPVSRILPREAASIFAWMIFPWMGFVLLFLVVFLSADVVWFVYKWITSVSQINPERRVFIQRGFGLSALGLVGLLGVGSLWNGLRGVSIKPLSVVLKKLPQSLDGLRIVQITDLHIGPMIHNDWLKHVVDQVNELKPDLIAITGDVVDGSVEELQQDVAALAGLTAPLGVYFVTGNHEYYSGVESWCAAMTGLGIRVLRNERVSITAGDKGESFDLAGVDDWGSHQFPGQGPDLPKALQGRDTSKALVLLAHQPAAIHEAAAHGVDLQLSGHTHGGQIWPFAFLVFLQQPYVEGLHRHRDTMTQIYVSPGTGFWGPPMRLGTTAEITHITLSASAG